MVDLELTWQHLLSEFRPKQTKDVCVNQPMGLYTSLYDYIIHVALITTSRVSLIARVQLPLVLSLPPDLSFISSLQQNNQKKLWKSPKQKLNVILLPNSTALLRLKCCSVTLQVMAGLICIAKMHEYYVACTIPALNESFVLQCFECGNTVK